MGFSLQTLNACVNGVGKLFFLQTKWPANPFFLCHEISFLNGALVFFFNPFFFNFFFKIVFQRLASLGEMKELQHTTTSIVHP